VIFNKVAGDSPKIDLEKEKNLHNVVLNLIENKLINSAHDISEGGIISSLAECCIINIENSIGANVNIPIKEREDFSLFSESQSRIIVSVSEESKSKFENKLKEFKQPFFLLG